VSLNRHAPRSLSLALESFAAAVSPASTLARVQAVWAGAVGAAIAAAASPTAERDGVLTVRCEAAVWSAELELMSCELLGRLNAALGEELLHKLRCRVG
jgi:predicted nucleic acid-binding Zn ribbon protein